MRARPGHEWARCACLLTTAWRPDPQLAVAASSRRPSSSALLCLVETQTPWCLSRPALLCLVQTSNTFLRVAATSSNHPHSTKILQAPSWKNACTSGLRWLRCASLLATPWRPSTQLVAAVPPPQCSQRRRHVGVVNAFRLVFLLGKNGHTTRNWSPLARGACHDIALKQKIKQVQGGGLQETSLTRKNRITLCSAAHKSSGLTDARLHECCMCCSRRRQWKGARCLCPQNSVHIDHSGSGKRCSADPCPP